MRKTLTLPTALRSTNGFLRQHAGRLALTGAVAIAAAGIASPAYAGNDVSTARELAAKTTPPAPVVVKKPAAVKPAQVAGLSKVQMKNAETIVKVGEKMGLDERAQTIALMTAMQESNLRNLASDVIPESFDYDNQGSGSDHDSIGLFQQRPSMGWGSVEEIMDPEYSAKAFYKKLERIDYHDMGLGEAAQTVQVSAFPDAYDKHEDDAEDVVDSVQDAIDTYAKKLAEANEKAKAAGVPLS